VNWKTTRSAVPRRAERSTSSSVRNQIVTCKLTKRGRTARGTRVSRYTGAECAGEQGRFSRAHERLRANTHRAVQ
jgi:hypothetical protein